MLGVVSYDQDTAGDLLLKEYAQLHGFGDTYVKTPVGVYLGEEGKTVPDPFFGGEGPARTGSCAADGASSAAVTARRTRWSRTTCTWPSGVARR